MAEEPGDLEALRGRLAPLFAQTGGIDSWLGPKTPPAVVQRLLKLDAEPLSREQLNQLLVLSHEAGVSASFFSYYWLHNPEHPYDVTKVSGYSPAYVGLDHIISLDHLSWGLCRFYTDALLYFGNIRSAYRSLRSAEVGDLEAFFGERRLDTKALKKRGPALPLRTIAKDDRYLISEMACKSLEHPAGGSELAKALASAYAAAKAEGLTEISVRELLVGRFLQGSYAGRQIEFVFSADEILDKAITSDEDLSAACAAIVRKFDRARSAALENTQLYLSMVEELDVYVATSMRTREDFRNMADFCEGVFSDPRLQEHHLRYFDPTLSAAEGHEDKGLIECLMVKCAKALVYHAGSKESYGKDAEAAMALSLGKPVIFYCDEEQRGRFYKDVHPLSRLIDFNTGVAVGVMVATRPSEVIDLLVRVFTNDMEYSVRQPQEGNLKLHEVLSDCVVRLQTRDELLRETFWNYYQHRRALAATIPSLR